MSEDEKRELTTKDELQQASGGDGYETPDVETSESHDSEQGVMIVPVAIAANVNMMTNINANFNSNMNANTNMNTNINTTTFANTATNANVVTNIVDSGEAEK